MSSDVNSPATANAFKELKAKNLKDNVLYDTTFEDYIKNDAPVELLTEE